MELDDIVDVHCTNNEKVVPAAIVTIGKDAVRVMIEGGVVLWFNKTKQGVYVSSYSGLEFTIKTNI